MTFLGSVRNRVKSEANLVFLEPTGGEEVEHLWGCAGGVWALRLRSRKRARCTRLPQSTPILFQSATSNTSTVACIDRNGVRMKAHTPELGNSCAVHGSLGRRKCPPEPKNPDLRPRTLSSPHGSLTPPPPAQGQQPSALPGVSLRDRRQQRRHWAPALCEKCKLWGHCPHPQSRVSGVAPSLPRGAGT